MTTPTPFVQSSQIVTDTTLPLITADAVINAGTIGVFDFGLDAGVSDGSPLASGGTLANLQDNANPIIYTGPNSLPYSGGGYQFGTSDVVATPEKMALPAEWKLPTTNLGLMFTVWFKYLANTLTTAETIGGFALAANSSQYLIFLQASGILGFSANSTQTGAGAALVAGNIYQASVAFTRASLASTAVTRTCMLNGVVLRTDALTDSGALTAPGTLGTPGIGATNTTPDVKLSMIVYRAILEDLGVSGASPSAQCALDYAQNNGRFT